MASTTIIDAFAGRSIATGLELVASDYDANKPMYMTAFEAAVQIAATGILSVQLSRLLYADNTMDLTGAMGLQIFVWDQPKLKRKVAGIEKSILSQLFTPVLGDTANTGRGAGRAALQDDLMSR